MDLDAVIVSDLHLGSSACQAGAILRFLGGMPRTRRLVLNGDVLESTTHRLRREHWAVLSLLRSLTQGTEVVWVAGNHDHDAEAVAHLVGARFAREHSFRSGRARLLCMHGDRWDRFITRHPGLTLAADLAYGCLQKASRRLAVEVKRRSKTLLRNMESVRGQARDYARGRADFVCCGHTHRADAPGTGTTAPGEPLYFNSGCWTDLMCHYLAVRDGSVRLVEFQP